MKEILDKLLATDVLSEEARNELTTAIQAAFDEAVAVKVNEHNATKDAEVEALKEQLTVEYATSFAADREALIEAVDTKVEEMLKEELNELADSISDFRDLEVEYAAKLVEEKTALAEAVEADMAKLVERLDTFLELRLSEEFTELRESIEEVKKVNIGRKLFEAALAEVKQYVNVDSDVDNLTTQLEEAKAELAKRDEALTEAQKQIGAAERKEKMEEVLSSLQNRPREIMEAILKPVPTDKLQETYEKFIGRVLHESVTNNSSEKESANSAVEAPVLAEGENSGDAAKVEKIAEATTVVTGDTDDSSEVPAVKQLSESAKVLQRLAGITTA